MSASLEAGLRELEARCVSLCREYEWLSALGTPDYQLLRSHPSTFRDRADLMLLAIHAWHEAAPAYTRQGESWRGEPEQIALPSDPWGGEPGSRQQQDIASGIAGMFGAEPGQVLHRAAVGNMIPFRTDSISRLPDALRKQGLTIGGRLVACVQPRVLVLLGGDRVLFRMAVSELPGRVVDSTEETFGKTQRAYRDVVIADNEDSTFAAVIPLHAPEEGLSMLRRRLKAHQLIAEQA